MNWKLLSLCFLPGVAFAQLACDGFRAESGYSESTLKNGALSTQNLNGPTGWAGKAWDVSGPNGSDLFVFREEAGLSFPAIAYPGGGGVQIVPIDESPRTRARNLEPAVVFSGRTTIYMSFLLRLDAPHAFGTAWAAFEHGGGNNLGLGAGIHEGNLVALLRTSKGERVLQEIGPAVVEKTYYFVIKLIDSDGQWKGTDEMEIWINPSDVSSEAAATATAEHHFEDISNYNAAAEFNLGRAMLYVANFARAHVLFDELILGESFESVTRRQ